MKKIYFHKKIKEIDNLLGNLINELDKAKVLENLIVLWIFFIFINFFIFCKILIV